MSRKKAFTLVEVLISIAVIAIISAASYTTFAVLSGSERTSRNHLTALTLLQGTLEEARAIAKNNFYAMNASSFVDFNQTRFPGFHRNVTVTSQSSSLKKADVTINWKSKGQVLYDQYGNPYGVSGDDRFIRSSLTLSMPPEPLPANIHGLVTNSENGSPVPTATVNIQYTSAYDPYGNPFVTSATTLTDLNGRFTFIDADGNYILKTGNWSLRATKTNYEPSVVIQVPNLSSREDREVNLTMIPKGAPAYINGRFVTDTGENIKFFEVYLYQGGGMLDSFLTNNSGFSFTIDFATGEGQKCFTVLTMSSYTKGYVGNFCDNDNWGKNYNYRGWSSSVVREDGSVVCQNPWAGNASLDRICVTSGETKDLGDIALVPLPWAIMSGTAYKNDGSTVNGARINVLWHSGGLASQGVSGANGSYTVAVPALQELFPSQPTYYFKTYALADLETMGCCGELSTNTATDPTAGSYYTHGPAYTGSSFTQDFHFPDPNTIKCGDVIGYVKDGKTGSALSGASITIAGKSAGSNATGRYEFICPGGAIPTGTQGVDAVRNGYYTFTTGYNYFYATQPGVTVMENQTSTYPDIMMWPGGGGILQGRIVNAGSGAPLDETSVILDLGTIWSQQSLATGSDGIFTFEEVPESWPPPEVVGNPYYRQEAKTHRLDISKTLYVTKILGSITLDNNQNKDMGDVSLSKQSQL